MKYLYCYDNEIIKWTYGDNLYCLHIQHDDVADNNPRWWDDHIDNNQQVLREQPECI